MEGNSDNTHRLWYTSSGREAQLARLEPHLGYQFLERSERSEEGVNHPDWAIQSGKAWNEWISIRYLLLLGLLVGDPITHWRSLEKESNNRTPWGGGESCLYGDLQHSLGKYTNPNSLTTSGGRMPMMYGAPATITPARFGYVDLERNYQRDCSLSAKREGGLLMEKCNYAIFVC